MHGSISVAVVAAAALCAGCSKQGSPEPASLEAVASSEHGMLEESRPARVYYDLTKYGWYKRAEPLVFQQTSFAPRGVPVSIALAKLHLAGNYQGVDFYVMRNDSDRPEALYVPVHEAYWLIFVATNPARVGD